MAKPKTEKPKYGVCSNVAFMLRLAWTNGEKKVPLLTVAVALLAVASNLVGLYLSPVILSAVEKHVPFGELLLTIAGFVLASMTVSSLSSYVGSNVLYGRTTVRMFIFNLINQKSANTSYPNLGEERFRNLLNKGFESTNNNSSATEAVWGTLGNVLTNLLGFAFYVGLLSTVQPVLLAVIIATSAVNYFVGRYVYAYGYRHREEESEIYKRIRYYSNLATDTGYGKEIRIFGLRPWLTELRDKSMRALTAFRRKCQTVYLWANAADLLTAFLRNGVAYAYLISLVLREGLDVSAFLLYFSAVGGFSGWVSGILGGLNTLHNQSLDISTVREFLDYDEPFRFSGGDPLPDGPSHELRLENVSFRYPGAEKDALSHVDLTLRPGEKIAVVGLNGAGKTTLIRLLCGFLDPTEGRVLLDGKDVRDFNRAEYYTLFSAVFQNFSLLAATVETNVAQTEDDIDEERVKDCLEKAGLTEKVDSLPNGRRTYLNREVYDDAVLLSGGETQRLMLARALYKDAPFLFLDEPTAALDPIAEADLYQRYDEMSRGKSSVYISHRLASTRFCDRILLLSDARICEEGTHEELLRLNGKYAALFEVQSKYYKEGGTEDEAETR